LSAPETLCRKAAARARRARLLGDDQGAAEEPGGVVDRRAHARPQRQAGDDEWRGYWLKYPLEELFADAAPEQPPVSLELHTDDGPVTVRTVDGRVRVSPGAAQDPDAVVTGRPEDVIELLKGTIDVRGARRRGVQVEGDAETVARVRPRV